MQLLTGLLIKEMNTKADKAALLKDISAGVVKPVDIPADPIIISKGDEMFYGLMMIEAPVLFVGEARKVLNDLVQSSDIDLREK